MGIDETYLSIKATPEADFERAIEGLRPILRMKVLTRYIYDQENEISLRYRAVIRLGKTQELFDSDTSSKAHEFDDFLPILNSVKEDPNPTPDLVFWTIYLLAARLLWDGKDEVARDFLHQFTSDERVVHISGGIQATPGMNARFVLNLLDGNSGPPEWLA